MSGPQFMPFYIGDYLRDTQHLTTEQHGAYLLLIFACWTRGGNLPNNDAELAAIARLSLDAWKASRGTIAKLFKISVKFWSQKRVAVELKRAQHLHEVRSKAGSKGGSKTQARARVPQPQPQPHLQPEIKFSPPLVPPSRAKGGGRGRRSHVSSPRTVQIEGFAHALAQRNRDC